MPSKLTKKLRADLAEAFGEDWRQLFMMHTYHNYYARRACLELHRVNTEAEAIQIVEGLRAYVNMLKLKRGTKR